MRETWAEPGRGRCGSGRSPSSHRCSRRAAIAAPMPELTPVTTAWPPDESIGRHHCTASIPLAPWAAPSSTRHWPATRLRRLATKSCLTPHSRRNTRVRNRTSVRIPINGGIRGPARAGEPSERSAKGGASARRFVRAQTGPSRRRLRTTRRTRSSRWPRPSRCCRPSGRDLPELTVAEVAGRAGLDRGTAFRLIHTLVGLGYLRAVPDSRALPADPEMPGTRLLRPRRRRPAGPRDAAAARAGAGRRRCRLARRAGSGRGDLSGPGRDRDLARHGVVRRPGTRIGAYATALGQAILAWLPQQEQVAHLESVARVKLSERTLTDLDALMARLAEVRARGYAVSDGENAYGLVTVAAPVLDATRCALRRGEPHDRQQPHVQRGVHRPGRPAGAAPGRGAERGRASLARRHRGARGAAMIPTITPDLRLLADDLTGALDTAAELTALCGPVPVLWDGAATVTPQPGSVALDSGTREAARDTAVAQVEGPGPGAGRRRDRLQEDRQPAARPCRRGARRLPRPRAPGSIACCAPAFPAQGRITRGGAHAGAAARMALVAGRRATASLACWRPRGCRHSRDVSTRRCRPASPCSMPKPRTISRASSRWAAQRAGPVLWCGSGGLARALGGRRPGCGRRHALARAGARAVRLRPAGDRAAAWRPAARPGCGSPDGGGAEAARIARQLDDDRRRRWRASTCRPASTARAKRRGASTRSLHRARAAPAAARHAARRRRRDAARRSAAALGAHGLEVTGLVAPGVPRSVLRGGAWDGVAVVSKSGAFGADALLARPARRQRPYPSGASTHDAAHLAITMGDPAGIGPEIIVKACRGAARPASRRASCGCW